MDVKQQRALLAASVAGILAAIGSVGFMQNSAQAHGKDHDDDDAETVACYGINKCKGTGDCGGEGHSCAGQNECAGHGYIELNHDDCLRIQGGRLAAADAQPPKAQ